MQLAVYRIDGKIHKTHKVDGSIGDVENKVIEYNKNSHNDIVEVVYLQENSLEMYLYNNVVFKVEEHKQELENMSDSLRDMASRIEWLYEQAKAKKYED